MNSIDEDDDNQAISSNWLLGSFLWVVGIYVVYLLMMLNLFLLMAWFISPETISLLQLEPEEFEKILDSDPERIFPNTLQILLIVGNAIVCFGLGHLLSRYVPISKFNHAIFFAVILFVHNLQIAIGANVALQTTFALFAATSPIAVMLGAHLYLKKIGTD